MTHQNDRLRRLFEGWCYLWAGEEPPWSLALVRIGLGLVLLWDFSSVAWLGLVEVLWAPYEAGGLVDLLQRMPIPPVYRVLPPVAGTAWGLAGVMWVGALLLALGVATRWVALVLVLVSAQLALITPNSDRGIDMMMRNVLLILVFSGAGQAWSLGAWWRRRRGGEAVVRILAWPRRLLLFQLVLMYFAAGVQKVGSVWLPVGDFAAIYIILHDPMIARFKPAFGPVLWRLSQLGTVGTLIFEWGTPMILLAAWYRHTRLRGGRLRAHFNRLEAGRLIVALGVLLHLGIAASMNLGIFPWAMLALYPAFFHPDEVGALWRTARRYSGAIKEPS